MFEHIYSDIQNEADWVLTFKSEFSDKARQDRKALEQAWTDARKEMFIALSEYPRNVSEVAFSNRFDERFGHPSGRTREFTEPTPAITDETLTGRHPALQRCHQQIFRQIPSGCKRCRQPTAAQCHYSCSRNRNTSQNSLSRWKGAGENTRIAEFNAETAAEVDTCRTPGETHQTRR